MSEETDTLSENTTDDQNQTGDTMGTKNEALDQPLPGLINAENRSEYADRHRIQYYDGVLVVNVRLSGNVSEIAYPEDKFESVIDAEGRRVVGRVKVESLQPLSENKSIERLSPRSQPTLN